VKDRFYQPDRGDLIYLHFTLHAGTEQAARRLALVLSPRNFNIATGLAFVCPITNQVKGSSFEVGLPKGTGLTGVVLTDHMRSLDWVSRQADYHSKAPEDLVMEVLGRIEAILTIDFGPV
jgi:mRNA interferase MazF